VVKSLAIVAALAGVASADDHCDADNYDSDACETWQPYTRSLGLQASFTTLPFEGHTKSMLGLGVSFEQRLAGRFRALAEYEYGWIGDPPEDDEDEDDVELEGTVHRGLLALRARIGQGRPKLFKGEATFYVDVEAGGGMLGGSEPMLGDFRSMYGLVGVRLGYGFHDLDEDVKSSRTYEGSMIVRAIKTEHGTGLMATINIAWGD
jgi:hypothetical protein